MSHEKVFREAYETQQFTPELREISEQVEKLTHGLYHQGKPHSVAEEAYVMSQLSTAEQMQLGNFHQQQQTLAEKGYTMRGDGGGKEWGCKLDQVRDQWEAHERRLGVELSGKETPRVSSVIPEAEVVLGENLCTCLRLPVRWPRSLCLSSFLEGALVQQLRVGVSRREEDKEGEDPYWLPFLVSINGRLLDAFPFADSRTWSYHLLEKKDRAELDRFRDKVQERWRNDDTLWDAQGRKIAPGCVDYLAPRSEGASLHQYLPFSARSLVDFNYHTLHAVFPHQLQTSHVVVDTVEVGVRDCSRQDLPLIREENPQLLTRSCIKIIRRKKVGDRTLLFSWDRCRYRLPVQPEVLLPRDMTMHTLSMDIPASGCYDSCPGDCSRDSMSLPVVLHNSTDITGVMPPPGHPLYPEQNQDEVLDDPEVVFDSSCIRLMDDPSWRAAKSHDTGDVSLHGRVVDLPVIRCLEPLPLCMNSVRCWILTRLAEHHPVRLFYEEKRQQQRETQLSTVPSSLRVDPREIHGNLPMRERGIQKSRRFPPRQPEEPRRQIGRVMKQPSSTPSTPLSNLPTWD